MIIEGPCHCAKAKVKREGREGWRVGGEGEGGGGEEEGRDEEEGGESFNR